MSQAQPIITPARAEAYVASALRVLGWLLGVILRIGASGRSARLKRALNRAEYTVECTLFLKAVALYGPPPQRKRNPRAAPNGFRRVVRHLRTFLRSARIRARKANALTRVLVLIDALARPERFVAYFFKQICKGLRLGGLVLVAPPADALDSDAILASASAVLDSS